MIEKIRIYYDPANDKAYRLINLGFHTVNFKEIKTNTGRAKMNERINTITTKEWVNFSNKFLPIRTASNLCHIVRTVKEFKELHIL